MGKAGSICLVIIFVFGVITIIFSIAMLAGGFEGIFNIVLHKKLEIKDGTQANDIWVNIPVPLIMRVYIFNLTNPDQFLNGAKPIVEELGPYTYREYHHKEDVSYNSNSTVTYFQKRWWIWDDDLSGGSPDDIITTLNTIPVSAAHSVDGETILMKGLNNFFNQVNETAVIQATASQILFDGYEDPLLDFIHNIVGDYDDDSVDFNSLSSIFPPGLMDYDKFAWFYKRNNSVWYDGIYNMNNGVSGVENFGMINWWNYTQNTTFFEPPCNRVSGSAGEMWPPHQQKDFIQFYSSDLCMTMTLYFIKEVMGSYGINAYRYWGSKETFANKTYKPENECFCVKGTCGPTGLLNAESCRMGAPAFISFPHFLNADPALLKDVQGLSPDHLLHSFFIDINPELGIPIEVAARMQINIQVKPYPGPLGIKILKKVPEVILPMIWFEVLSRMTEDLGDQIKPVLFLATSVVPAIVFGICLGIGVLMVIHVIWCCKKKHAKQSKDSENTKKT